MLNRVETERDNEYDYKTAYKAWEVEEPLRSYYHEFSRAKARANKWFELNNLPFILRFKPTREYDPKDVMSNMQLQLYYILDSRFQRRLNGMTLSKNQIMIDCHWNSIARLGLQLWDKYDNKEFVENAARQLREVESAYDSAY